jgi:acyl carrier protein
MGLDASYEIDLDVTADTIGADSLDQVELLMALEDRFNLDACIETNFKGTTLRELVQYVRTAKRIKKLHTPLNPQHFLDDAVYVRELASHNPGKLVLGIQTTLSKMRSISKEHGHVMVMPHSSFCVYQYGETVLDTQDFHLAVKKYNELLNT